MLAEIGPLEIGGIVLLVIILFGAKKLPEIGKGLGKGLREFRDATKGLTDDEKSQPEDKPAVPPVKDDRGAGPAAGALLRICSHAFEHACDADAALRTAACRSSSTSRNSATGSSSASARTSFSRSSRTSST